MTRLSIYRTSDHGKDILTHREDLPWKVKDQAPATVIIPSILPRLHSLNRALKSVECQDLRPEQIIVQVDHRGEGAASTRNKALQKAETKVVTFLDDDDYMGHRHIKAQYQAMEDQDADYVYPWFWIAGPSFDPFQHLDWHLKPWKDEAPHQTTITTMVRTELAQSVGFHEVDHDRWPAHTPEGYTFGEDFQFTMECLGRGAKIYHVQEQTWAWVITGHNTSGKGEAWEHARA